jgi:molybdopterin-guanine dinucleotide biosynthesis protein A
MIEPGPILGVVLAGGAGRRIGGGKAWRNLAGHPLIGHVIDRIAPQVAAMAISGPADDAKLASIGLTVLADAIPGAGPLGGIVAALEAAPAILPKCWAVLIAPGDCPFLPGDLVPRLACDVAAGAPLTHAVSNGQRHPTVSLWSPALAPALAHLVRTNGIRRVGEAVRCLGGVAVSFDAQPFDRFFNVNSADDLAQAEAMHRVLASHGRY